MAAIDLISLETARTLGLKKYFLGTPCSRGHVAERFVSSRGCVQCAAERGKSASRKRWREAYALENRERILEAKRADYHANKERIKAAQFAYRERNREKIRKHEEARRRADPEMARATSLNAAHRRRAKTLGGMTSAELFAWKRAQPKCCFWCGKECEKIVADHFVPLALGGRHEVDNLVPACYSCNSRKRAKPPQVFAAEIGKSLEVSIAYINGKYS